jgi:methyl coenzyme M reductase beta subunit
VAVSLEAWISYLIAEFAANTFVFLGALKAARTVSATLFKAFLYNFYDLFVFV